MIKLIGDKNVFAIEVEILEFAPGLNSNVRIWINDVSLGNSDEVSYLSAIIRALHTITNSPDKFWLPELNNLTCKEIFYTITPFYNSPNEFFELSPKEQEEYIKYDIFLSEWGDAFNDWDIKTIINNGICKFLWVYTPLGDDDSYEVRNDIQCFDVSFEYMQEIYRGIERLIPVEYWPTMIPRIG